jgi:glyoxylase-like metal-dependent hydrolase (beta-lactamase superfamily II)
MNTEFTRGKQKMIHSLRRFVLLSALFIFGAPALAAPLQVQKVTDGVYALVGDIGQRSPENFGNNATFGVIVTNDGVVLVDTGGSHNGAKQIHETIRSISDKPVRLVINTGGQDHRWVGNDYFKARGARIVASAAAVADQRARTTDQLITLNRLVSEKLMAGTEAVHAGEMFENRLELEVGGVRLVLRHAGTAHTPGDSFVWLPQKKVVFAGDIVYVDRLLAVTAESRSQSWIKVFEEMAALKPEHVVPGHGPATMLARARADTYDYLVALRTQVKAFMDGGGEIYDVGKIDQSRFKHIKLFEELKGRNAQQVFQEMEWE